MKKIYLFILLMTLMVLPLGAFADKNQAKYSWDLQLDNDKQLETFKIDIDSPDYNQKEGNNSSAVLLKGGNVIAKIPFRLDILADEPISTEFSVLKSEGLSPDVKILQVDFQPQACAVAGGNYLFLWDGTKLYKGPVTTKISDAGVFNVSSEVILPDNRVLGEANTIVVMTIYRQWDNNIDNYNIDTINIEKYLWDGKEVKSTSNNNYKVFQDTKE